jgi:MATE family multidrug resistance protein
MFILFFSMIECFAPHWLISLDFDTTLPENQLLVTHAKIFLFLCGVFQIFESIRIALFGALRSLKDTHFTLLVSFVTLWVIALPLGLFFEKYYWSYGQGLWIGMIIANILSVFFLEWRLKKTLLNNFR